MVLISGHMDSWDVGLGAMDDGGGMMISWQALVGLHRLGLAASRTIRAVLWTGEVRILYCQLVSKFITAFDFRAFH